jgi:hypothetical protein
MAATTGLTSALKCCRSMSGISTCLSMPASSELLTRGFAPTEVFHLDAGGSI